MGTADDIREHLKHLGPSNLASRPRQTRYQNVKIKRGSNSPSRSGQTDADSMPDSHAHRPSAAIVPTSDGTAMTSSGGLNPRDGAHAVLIKSSNQKPTDSPANNGPTVSIPEQVNEEQDSAPQSANSRQASSAILDGESTLDNNYTHRGPARSGSITEHVVDVNGIRKVVLHTTSSNSSSEGEGQASTPQFPVRQGSEVLNLNEPEGEPTDNSKKKRRNRKHKKSRGSNHKNEETPLLP